MIVGLISIFLTAAAVILLFQLFVFVAFITSIFGLIFGFLTLRKLGNINVVGWTGILLSSAMIIITGFFSFWDLARSVLGGFH